MVQWWPPFMEAPIQLLLIFILTNITRSGMRNKIAMPEATWVPLWHWHWSGSGYQHYNLSMMFLQDIIQQRNVSNVPWWLVELGFVVTAHSGQSKGIAGEASGLSLWRSVDPFLSAFPESSWPWHSFGDCRGHGHCRAIIFFARLPVLPKMNTSGAFPAGEWQMKRFPLTMM